MVTITLNGRPHEIRSETTVGDVLAGMKVELRHVAVEVNQEIVPRSQHAVHRLREGDRVEVVTLVGGG